MQQTTIDTTPRTSLSQELKLIPTWAITVAVLLMAGVQVLFHVWMPAQHNPPPLALRIVAGILASLVLAAFVLLIGYVNRDAGRRNMSRTLWTLLVILIPNGLGFILYFLLRQPIVQSCPRCGGSVQPSFNYCPRCNLKLHPHCAQCQRFVNLADTYCSYCGYKLDQIVHGSS